MFTIILVRVQMTPVSLKQSLHTTVGKYIFACIAALLLACSTVPMRADVTDCTCNADSLISDNLAICIDGTNYVVDVYGCRRVAYSAPWIAAVCLGTGGQNQVTNITRVCFVGAKPVPIDPVATFGAILCALDPCKTPGIMGAIVPPTSGSVYCWTVIFPKCLSVDNVLGCIYKCGDGCCRVARRWSRGLTGSCDIDFEIPCHTPTTCPGACLQIECPRSTCCR